MTTVKELIHQLTAEYVDLDSEIQIQGENYDYTTNFTVTATADVVRIEVE